jgi:hypothetical protein
MAVGRLSRTFSFLSMVWVSVGRGSSGYKHGRGEGVGIVVLVFGSSVIASTR